MRRPGTGRHTHRDRIPVPLRPQGFTLGPLCHAALLGAVVSSLLAAQEPTISCATKPRAVTHMRTLTVSLPTRLADRLLLLMFRSLPETYALPEARMEARASRSGFSAACSTRGDMSLLLSGQWPMDTVHIALSSVDSLKIEAGRLRYGGGGFPSNRSWFVCRLGAEQGNEITSALVCRAQP